MGPPWKTTVRSRCPPFEAHGVRDVDPRQAEGATKAHEASISDGPTVLEIWDMGSDRIEFVMILSLSW